MIRYTANKSTTAQINNHISRCADELFMSNYGVDIESYSSKIRQNSVTLEAWSQENILVGLIACYANDLESKTAFITNVSVIKEFRKQGISQKLLTHLLLAEEIKDFNKIKLKVNIGNEGALKLYHNNGFVEIDKDQFQYTMERDVNQNSDMKINMIYAPVMIQVYDRVDHFKKCVESLASCRGSEKTTLYIASDAAQNAAAIPLVNEIRSYCKTITGFLSVELIAYPQNIGSVKSLHTSLDTIFETHDRVIYTEDDNVFSPNFLEFVNEGLEHYKDNETVYSICGYRHPFEMPADFNQTTFASPYTSAWGLGLWRDKFRSVDFYPRGDYWKERKQWKQTMPLGWHELMEEVLLRAAHFGDALMEYHCLQNDMVSIFPYISLVRNFGNDGSGDHSGINSGYETQLMCGGDEKFAFTDDLTVDQNIARLQCDSIDFPFMSAQQLRKAKRKRKTKKMLRDFVAKRPWLKTTLKKMLNR